MRADQIPAALALIEARTLTLNVRCRTSQDLDALRHGVLYHAHVYEGWLPMQLEMFPVAVEILRKRHPRQRVMLEWRDDQWWLAMAAKERV